MIVFVWVLDKPLALRITYSDVVALLKVVLPITALALLATLFLVSSKPDVNDSIPFADVELEQRLRDQQVTSPYYSGQTNQGHIVTVTAALAHPDSQDPARVIADDLIATIATQSQGEIVIASNEGELDNDYNEVELIGDVVITTSQDYVVNTQTMTVSLQEARGETGGLVTAQSPIGELEAGRMAIRPVNDTDDIFLFFTKGVKLVYMPTKTTR